MNLAAVTTIVHENSARAEKPYPDAANRMDLPDLLRRIEEAYIDAALALTGGNRTAAAELLGLQRTTLVEKLKRRAAVAPARAGFAG
jgi:sigma-54 specific flagellar transcriptional regulator A